MGIKDKLRNSLQGPITVMQPSYQDQTGADANYFVQLDSKYDFGMPDSSTKTDRLDFSAYPSEYQAEYHISEQQQQQHGEEMQFGTPDGPRVPRLEEENDEFSEYLNLMVHFRERDFSKTLRKIDVSFFTTIGATRTSALTLCAVVTSTDCFHPTCLHISCVSWTEPMSVMPR